MNDNPKPKGAADTLPEAKAKTPDQWREYCGQLLAEIEHLKAETSELREQRFALTQMIPVPEEIKALEKLSMEEVLAMAQFEPSLLQLIEQFEKQQGW